ncbi:Aldehyde-alcohol dehydrogenase [compost metagenome]
MSNTGYFHYWMRTQVHSGAGALVRVPALMQQLGGRRVLLVTGAGVRRAGLVERLEAVFAANRGGGQPALVGVVEADAAAESVNHATAVARSLQVDAIVALGGGRVLDAAKAIKYALGHGLADIQDVLLGGIRLETSPPAQPLGIAHIAVPTLAGSGAEASNAAAIRCERLGGYRALLVAPYLDADIAVLDAQLTAEVPVALAVAGGLHALAQALEVIASPASNAFSDASAFAAIDLIRRWLPLLSREPGNAEARAALLQASMLAGQARAGVLGAMPVHGCASALGLFHDIPFGQLKGALLPVALDVLRDYYRPAASRLARAFAITDAGCSSDERLQQVIALLQALLDETGMPRAIPEVAQAEMQWIVQAVGADPAAMFLRLTPEQVGLMVARLAGA